MTSKISCVLLVLCSCILWKAYSSPLPTKKTSARDQSKAMSYLTRLGYLNMPDSRAGELRTTEEVREGLKQFQLYAGIPMTGVVDDKTMEMMALPRCGMPDFGRSDRTKRRKRYAIQGTKWNKSKLTYMIEAGGPRNQISETQVEQQVEKAFKEWEAVSTLTFTKTTDPNADILVKFRSGMHNDGYPFDGFGGTLAHGFYPHDNTGLSGDVHFDDDETWILEKGDRGTDFYWTALHEIGHALGLDHSVYRDAVMYPFYTGFKDNLKLNKDDVKGIHYIYGMPVIKVETAPPSDAAPTKLPSHACSVPSFDAVFAGADRITYFFSGEHYWTVLESGKPEGPFVIQKNWPELPSEGIDAAYQSEGKTTFFKGRRCWVFNGTQLIRGPVSIFDHFKDLDRSLAKIDAAFVWGANGRTYLFSGQHYWKYNEAWGRVDLGYPAKITGSWGGVPEHLDSAMTWINGRTYFFKDNGFWLFDNLDIQTAHTEPMMISSHWMKCRAGYDTTSTSSSASTSTERGDSSASLTTKNISILFISIIFSILNYVV